MARPRRIELAGAVYHLTSRGNARQSIYRDDGDRERFLSVLGEVVRRFHWLCHAYCLMDNHYHLLVETSTPNLSRGMRQLNGVYTQRFNQRHDRVGHLFQGRFTAILVEKDAHLLELCRYVVLNPVRARVVADPGQWSWSSYRAAMGHVATPGWLTTDWMLGQFGTSRQLARQRYREFVLGGRQVPSPWQGLKGQVFLGSEAFCQRFVEEARRQEVPRVQRQPVRPPLAVIFVPTGNRWEHAEVAYRSYGYRLREIAEHLGVHYATVSRWLRKEEKHKADHHEVAQY